MSSLKPPGSGLKPPTASKLVPPGSLTKRPRGESLDLETGMEVKKMRMGPPDTAPESNLVKSKSKSMMNVAGRTTSTISSSRGRGAPGARGALSRTNTTLNRTTLGRPTGPAAAAAAGRRATTASALNERTNTTRPGLQREKSSVKPRGGGAVGGSTGGKRPAWDLKGRLEDMEKNFKETISRVSTLENEKENLIQDCNLKKEVVVQTSGEIKELRTAIDVAQSEVASLKKKLADAEEAHNTEATKLRRQLEDAEFTKTSLERKLRSLEDELNSKQTEISGLKTSVAELTSSRAGIEASLSGAKNELEIARNRITELTAETESQQAEMEELRVKLNWEETQRRKMHNLVQELKGNIRVFCRVRPLLGEEVEKYKDIKHIKFNSNNNLELVKNTGSETDSIAGGLNKNMKYEFEFDQVFSPNTTQDQVFEEISQLVQSALDGYNVCVFAYGQTGSGKTFTMEGGAEDNAAQEGMIPKTIQQIFKETTRLKDKGWTYSLQVSFLEIYNEEIRDLLATEKNLKYEIKMCDSKGSDIYVTNLKVEDVTSEGQISSLLKRARKHRAVAETLCNERSSRSHSVFMLKITGSNCQTTESCCGTLNLVDLAGSERIKDSGSEGQRLTEAQAINKSLSNLSNVIMALAQKSSHVPYRNSKLTHLLHNSLGGNSKTLMFVNVSPKEDCFQETLSSLRFATKVNQCQIGTASKKTK